MKNSKLYSKGGNIYNKYTSENPIVKFMMKKFFKRVDSILDSVKISRVLDAGCGEGYLAQHIKDYSNELYVEGVDLSAEIIEVARKLHPQIKFSVGSVYHLPYFDNSFDLVVCSEVLEHLEYPEKALEELKRVSKRYCIITVPHEPFWRIANIMRLSYLDKLGNTPGHIQHFNKKTLKKLLGKYFKEVEIETSTLWLISLCKNEDN